MLMIGTAAGLPSCRVRCVVFLALVAFVSSFGWAQEPRLEAWHFLIGSYSDSTPSVSSDGTIYFGTVMKGLVAVTPRGLRKWAYLTPSEIWSSPAVGSDGTIYFGCRDRRLYAITPEGKLRWTFPTQAWVDSSPAVGTNGAVYFGSWDKNFYAVDANGKELWRFATQGPVVSSPAIDREGNIYFGSHDHQFYALSADGKKRWKFTTGGPIITSPALDGEGRVYFGSVDGFLYALERDGHLRWKMRTGGSSSGSPVIGMSGHVYALGSDELWEFDEAGNCVWKRGRAPFNVSPLVEADGTLFICQPVGMVAAFDLDHNMKWHAFPGPNGWSSPAITPSGLLLVMSMGKYQLVAFQGDAPLASTPWPKFRGNLRNTGNLADWQP